MKHQETETISQIKSILDASVGPDSDKKRPCITLDMLPPTQACANDPTFDSAPLAPSPESSQESAKNSAIITILWLFFCSFYQNFEAAKKLAKPLIQWLCGLFDALVASVKAGTPPQPDQRVAGSRLPG